jgi:hypothetical protein
MAKLTTKARDKLPAREFAGPDRSYPIPDKSHARNAKARASEMERKGRISLTEERRIGRKADAKLSKGKRK